jgi:hypothetical protein
MAKVFPMRAIYTNIYACPVYGEKYSSNRDELFSEPERFGYSPTLWGGDSNT